MRRSSWWVLMALCVLALAAPLRAQGTTANATPTAAPTTNTSLTFSGPDQLDIGGRTFTGVKLVASRYTKVEDASKATRENGIDEIFLKDIETGRLFVVHGGANGDLPGINDMKEGFTGNYRGRMVEIVKVEDESNTFKEGSWEVIQGFGKTIKKAFTENLVTSLATGGAGLIVAAILNAGAKASAATAATGAAAAATNTGTMIAARALLVSLVPALKAVAIGIAGFAVAYSLYNGIVAQTRERNQATIQMITAETVDQLPDARPPGYLDGLRTGIGIPAAGAPANATAPRAAAGAATTSSTAPRAATGGTATQRTGDPGYEDLPNRQP